LNFQTFALLALQCWENHFHRSTAALVGVTKIEFPEWNQQANARHPFAGFGRSDKADSSSGIQGRRTRFD